MDNFVCFLGDLSRSTNIDFSAVDEDGNLIYSSKPCEEDFNQISFEVILDKLKFSIYISKDYEVCIPLLKYTIENGYKELFCFKDQLVLDILKCKDVSYDKIEKYIPFIFKGCRIIIVQVEKNIQDTLDVIKQLYKNQDVISVIYNNKIIIIGKFDEIEDHVRSIKNSIEEELYLKCCISCSKIIYSIEELKSQYEDICECIMLAGKYDIKDEIIYCDNMLFEKIIYNIKADFKDKLFSSYGQKFDLFDNEMINTIERFIECGLNISDAAKKLYIHRNTLIYRLDKIYKETGFDIRKFKDAVLFLISFFIWKEKR